MLTVPMLFVKSISLSSGVPVPETRRIAMPKVAEPLELAVTPPNSIGIPDVRLLLSIVNAKTGVAPLVS